MSVRFKKSHDLGSEVMYQSQKLNNGDFDYWLIATLRDLREYLPEREIKHTYHIDLMAVAPSEVPETRRDSALSSLGLDDDEWERVEEEGAERLAILLAEAGIGASLWQNSGNNKADLLQAMRNEAQLVEMLFGFYMDRPENMIGSTGWDFIKGDIMAGLDRRMEAA